MILGKVKIDGITSFLFINNGKITGYQIVGWKKYTLNDNVFSELRKLILSNNNRVFEESDYKVVLDLDTGYTHYFKNGKEDWKKFYQMNGKDETYYLGEEKDTLRRKIGRIIYSSFITFLICVNIMNNPTKSITYEQNNVSNETLDITNSEVLFVEGNSIDYETILPLSVEEISGYILSSVNLNDEEKAFLNNQQLFSDLLHYINKNPELIESLRYELYNIDIQRVDVAGISGYNNGTQTLYVDEYDENQFEDFKVIVDHEFCHSFQCSSKDFNYLTEPTNELITAEYFDRTPITYSSHIKITMCLMEMVGTDAILQATICNDPSYLYDALAPYLTEEEISLFSIDTHLAYYTDEEENALINQLVCVLDKLYYGMYGESMWNNNMIASIMNDWDYERYYFNSEKLQNPMYASYPKVEEYTIEEAIALGYVHPYILSAAEKVSLDEWLQSDELKNINYSSIYEGKIVDFKYYRLFSNDNNYINITIEEAVEEGYISNVECSIVHKIPTDDLNNPYIKYDLEQNCRLEENKVIVTIYEKEDYLPIRNNISMLN